MDYSKKDLSRDENQGLLAAIGEYHGSLIPLISPAMLLNRYVRKLDQPYLKQQFYLNPNPAELKLRNHV